MKIIVQPQKGGSYKLLFYDGRNVRGAGYVELQDTPRGPRPTKYRVKWGQKKEYRHTPSKDLVANLRESDVRLTKRDHPFETFLSDFQVTSGTVNACRMCLLDEKFTPLDTNNTVQFGKNEHICLDCGRRELRREVSHIGRLGRDGIAHLEQLLIQFRNLDRVLATLNPDKITMGAALFDKLEAHPVMTTAPLDELPLPRQFIDASGVKQLMPAQQLAVEAGLLYGKGLLVVAATASGKTFIGEMAGMKNYLEGRGRTLFLVPLVALANQKYERFTERYAKFAKTGLLTGVSRLNLPETRKVGDRNPQAPIIVGTYEGVDNMIRRGQRMQNIATVVIDEVQMLEDKERGHRLDGMIARLKYLAPQAQFLYLSATIGSPKVLAKKLNCTLVVYSERPVGLERYLLFVERKQKIPTIKQMTTDEYKRTSSKGFRGQTIIFTNARARCHTIADALGIRAAAYHAGLSSVERRDVESRFLNGKLMAVVTTAALGAGVDFPASQVIFDALAMGRDWLSVQEFNQMAGRAGRPDFHDLGRVVILAEPGGSYSRENPFTEEEVAIRLLKGEMEEVAPEHDFEQSSEEYVANAIACGGEEADLNRINTMMVGSMEPVLPDLIANKLVEKHGTRLVMTPLARVMAEHFIGMERLLEIIRLTKTMKDPVEIIAELESEDVHTEKKPDPKKQKEKARSGRKRR
ncbi:MAG: DEAD/DEAH box helicase [Methanoregula sp.]|uniref:DEAD/DEAH box helicase n=1 Tax=Methanoregula sp. TaxID=2052170 RepID=UPI002601292B|nr:DEAD/DEAH box helicase [Methanoregula sp.]MCK9631737.1 DEAD/DEAH box helicase [Methanoregula sp.]